MSFTLSEDYLNQAIEELNKTNFIHSKMISSETGLAKISIVGTGIQSTRGADHGRKCHAAVDIIGPDGQRPAHEQPLRRPGSGLAGQRRHWPGGAFHHA